MVNSTIQHLYFAFGLALAVAVAGLCHVSLAHAQVQINNIAGATLEFSPEYPEPGDEVSALFRTGYLDVSSSMITWTVDGKTLQQGYGSSAYKFTAGEVGSRLVVHVSAVDSRNRGVETTKILTVGDVSFAWEGQTYTPSFYKGRALHSPGSGVTILALPTILGNDGSVLSSNDLVFEWEFDDSQTVRESGRGLDSVSFKSNNPYRNFDVKLSIKDLTGAVRNKSSITIPQAVPEALLYENNILLGVRYAHPLNNSYSMSSEELAIVAEPMHTSIANRLDANLSYEWRIGDQYLDTPGTIRLRPEGTGAGTAQISVNIRNAVYIGQGLQKRLTVYFNTKANARSRFTPETTAL